LTRSKPTNWFLSIVFTQAEGTKIWITALLEADLLRILLHVTSSIDENKHFASHKSREIPREFNVDVLPFCIKLVELVLTERDIALFINITNVTLDPKLGVAAVVKLGWHGIRNILVPLPLPADTF
jgi:hypothetical protein